MANKNLLLDVQYKISFDDIKYLLDSASRGSSYWCENELGYSSVVDSALVGEVTVKDLETNRKKTLNYTKIVRGLQVMAVKEPEHFADIVKGDYDEVVADIFLQCCLFGKVIYA